MTQPRPVSPNGWTLPRQRQFIKTLALTGSVQQAADAAGMPASSAFRLRLHPDAAPFRAAWKAALGACLTTLRERAFDRAINGTLRTVYENGVCVGREPVCNDQLLMFLLRRYDKDTPRSPEQALLDSCEQLVEADDPAPEAIDLPPPDPVPAFVSEAHEQDFAEDFRVCASLSGPDG